MVHKPQCPIFGCELPSTCFSLHTLFFQVSSCPHIAHSTILMHDTTLSHVVFQCIGCRATSSFDSVRYARWRKTPSGPLSLIRLACVVSCYCVGQSGSLTFYRTGVMLSYPTTKVSDSTTDKSCVTTMKGHYSGTCTGHIGFAAGIFTG